MRVLVDECLPVRVRLFFPDGVASTVEHTGWKGLKNGRLLAEAEAVGFDLLLTSDRAMLRGRDLSAWRLAMLVVPTNRWRVLEGMADAIRDAAARVAPGTCLEMPRGG